MKDLLVIGYGNELRSDDAVGPRVVEAVAAWRRPGIQTIVCHQLTPEMAEQVAGARAVIFVDAALAQGDESVQSQRIEPRNAASAASHWGDPRSLLALAQRAFGHCPPAWLVTVPVGSLDFGEQLSPLAERGMATALQRIEELSAAL